MAHQVLWVTQRGARHQQAALAAAPPGLAVTMRRSPGRDELLSLLPGVEFLVSERSGAIDAEMIAAGGALRLIQRLGSQTYDIDLQAARAAGVAVCAAPSLGCIMVAEHALMQILVLAKRARETMRIALSDEDFGPPRRADEDTFAYNWSRYRGVTGLWGSAVGILGMGEIGLELARRLRPFGCAIRYTKRRRLPEAVERELGVTFASADEIAATCDVVCALLPFLPETEQSLSSRFFAAMQPGSLFVSCGGSGVVDEAALAAALRSGRLAGAALDTYTFEPIAADNPLRGLALADPTANALLTPHIAGGTGPRDPQETVNPRSQDYANILAALAGAPLVGRLV